MTPEEILNLHGKISESFLIGLRTCSGVMIDKRFNWSYRKTLVQEWRKKLRPHGYDIVRESYYRLVKR